MDKNDTAAVETVRPLFRAADLCVAATILTRIRIPESLVDPARMSASAWTYPIVGAVVGLCGGGTLWFSHNILNLPASASALIALGTMILITGALHEDGLADCADGLGGGRDKQRALDIMKDSRMGAYGVVILVLFLLGRWSAIGELLVQNPVLSLVVAGAISRAPLPLVMACIPNARSDGMSRHVGRPETAHVAAAAIIGLVIAVSVLGFWGGALVTALAFAAAVPLCWIAIRKIKGQTGDVLGGVQQCAEISVLFALTAAPF